MRPNHGMAAAPDAGAQINGLAAGSKGPMTNPSLPVATDLDKMVHARDGELPSDYVSCPVVRSDEHGSFRTFCVVVVALIVADVFACLRAVAKTTLTFFGRAPQRCQKACRLIIDQRTRTTCGRMCCLPQDHGPVWNHACQAHVQLCGRVSSYGYI